MEAFLAFRIEHLTVVLAAIAGVDLASTSTIGVRFVAVGTVITEARLLGAVLPANWSNSREAILTVGVAEGTILLLISRAGRERLANSTAIRLLPAGVGDIGVMVIVMEVMDRGTIVVLFSVGQGLLRVMSELSDVLFIIISREVGSSDHWIIVTTVETTVMKRLIIEVLLIVVRVVMPFVGGSGRLVITGELRVMELIQVLNVVAVIVINNMFDSVVSNIVFMIQNSLVVLLSIGWINLNIVGLSVHHVRIVTELSSIAIWLVVRVVENIILFLRAIEPVITSIFSSESLLMRLRVSLVLRSVHVSVSISKFWVVDVVALVHEWVILSLISSGVIVMMRVGRSDLIGISVIVASL